MRSAVLLSSIVALSLSACGRARILSPSPADELRVEVRDLREQVEALERRNAELERSLSAEVRAEAGGDADAEAARPRLVAIELGSASGVRRDRQDPRRGTLVVYLETLDGRGRFLQATGRATVKAVSVEVDSPPRTLGERSYSPVEFRDAWRSGFMGTHYTLEVPVDIPDGARECAVLVELREAFGGGTFSRLRTVPIEPPAPDPSEPGR